MQILIFTKLPQSHQTSKQPYPPLDALIEAGHDAHVVDVTDITVSVEEGVHIKDGTALTADAAFVRNGDEGLATALEHHGIAVVNPPHTMALTADKWLTHLALAANHITQIPTWLLSADMPTSNLPSPTVIKTRWGAEGTGVTLHTRLPEAWNGPPSIAQPYIDASTDWRVICADDEAIAWERRQAHPGEWRANVSLGATIDAPPLPAAIKEIAIAALHATDLDYGGIDVVETPQGPQIIEVNAAAGWQGIYSLWGKDLYKVYTAALTHRLNRT